MYGHMCSCGYSCDCNGLSRGDRMGDVGKWSGSMRFFLFCGFVVVGGDIIGFVENKSEGDDGSCVIVVVVALRWNCGVKKPWFVIGRPVLAERVRGRTVGDGNIREFSALGDSSILSSSDSGSAQFVEIFPAPVNEL